MKARRIATMLILTVLVMMVFGPLVPLVAAQPPPEEPGEAENAPQAADPSYAPSDSPWLWRPEDDRNWPNMEPTGPAVPVQVEDPTAIEFYNIATGEIIIIPSSGEGQTETETGPLSVPPFEGLLPPGTPPESVLPPDDRVRITTTAVYPWRTFCKLRITWPDSATGGCSGAIIGCPDGHGYHVLTAGHCVFSHDHGGWARSVEVLPGYDNGYMPYYHAWATNLRSYSGWTSSGDTRHDWALITLDRNVGDYTGWLGRMTASSSNSIYTGVLNLAGYPGDKCSGNCMYYDADTGHSATEHNHWYRMDTAGGMSGSAVYRKVGNDRWILTVHTCGTGGCGISGKGVNHGTRLNNDKYDRIFTYCNADTPPTDRADLIDDGQSRSGFSPTTVARGVTSFNVFSDVRNVGTAASGSFRVAYYASTNTTISTGDYLIGTDVVSSISAFSVRDSDWTGTFPTSIPNGTYWVGWIIDSLGSVSEFDESNNIARKSGYQLVVCTPPAAPMLATPGNGSHTCDATPYFDWSSVSGASSYRIQVDDHSSFSSPAINTTRSSSNYTPGSPLGLGTYYWRVRATSSCGDGAWSPVWRFTIDARPAVPSNPSPYSGAMGVALNADLDWADAAAATSYDVYFGTLTTPTRIGTVSLSQYSLPTLLPDTTYYWKIVAKNACGETAGPLWRFRTAAAPTNQPPTNGTITPNSGAAPAGNIVYFTTTWADPNGQADLKACRLHIGRWAAPKSLIGNAVLLYQAKTNKIMIRNDRGTRWWGGKLVGSANVVQNSQAKVYCNLTTVSRSGNTISVRWAVEFKPPFRGRTKMYLKARDLAGLTSNLEQKGTWTVQ